MDLPPELRALVRSERQDVLSLYLDVDPTKPEHQSTHPAYRIWLRNALRDLVDRQPRETAKVLAPLTERVLVHVETRPPAGRGLVLFAADGLWQERVLPFPLVNRLSYGRPDVVPLLWALEEYNPYAILALDRERARLLVAYLGRTAVVSEETLELDTSDWRFKAGRPPSFAQRLGTAATRGSQRDTFVARVEDRVRRFWLGAVGAAAQWMRDLGIERLVLAGPPEAVGAVRDLLPDPVRGRLVAQVHLSPDAGVPEIVERTLPVAVEAEHRHEVEVVRRLLDAAGAGSGVLGRASTVGVLVQEQAMMVVADRDVAGEVWQCQVCGYVAAAPHDRCPTCGGPVEVTPVPQVLPLLAQRSGAALEVVTGAAAEALRPYEGVGALLRYVPGPTRPGRTRP
jgi:hypothetical protein